LPRRQTHAAELIDKKIIHAAQLIAKNTPSPYAVSGCNYNLQLAVAHSAREIVLYVTSEDCPTPSFQDFLE
jgi:hypothetical protein